MHKKHVLNVDRRTLNFSEVQDKRSNGFDVKRVRKLLYGKISAIKDIVKNIGSGYGLKKVTVFVNYVTCRGTVILKLKALRNIGSIKLHKSITIIKRLNTSFTMEPIFIKTVV